MDGITSRIYTDTNTLRYFGTAFREAELGENLRDHLILSPMSLLELLAQLATEDAEAAYAAIQAIPRCHNPRFIAVLPWSDDGLRAVFGMEQNPASFMEAISHAMNHCLAAKTSAELYDDSVQLKHVLMQAKAKTCANFAALLSRRKADGRLSEMEQRAILACAIASRAGAEIGGIDVDGVISQVDAWYVFECNKLENAAKEKNYSVEKHANDIYDADQLVHLLDPVLHFLTSDKGFKRTKGSSQAARIHIEPMSSLIDPIRATAVIKRILTEAG